MNGNIVREKYKNYLLLLRYNKKVYVICVWVFTLFVGNSGVFHCALLSDFILFALLLFIHDFPHFSPIFIAIQKHTFYLMNYPYCCRMCLVRCIIWIILSCGWYLLCSSWLLQVSFSILCLMMSSLAYSYINNRQLLSNKMAIPWHFILRYEIDNYLLATNFYFQFPFHQHIITS